MLSLNSIYYQIPYSLRPFSCLKYPLFPNLFFTHYSQRTPRKYRKLTASLHFSGFVEFRRGKKFGLNLNSSWCLFCKQSDEDIELEGEILDFMAKSEKPTMFPTREELMKAGRMDLVVAIKNRGGWYSLGWDDDIVEDIVEEAMDFDTTEFRRRVESCEESASLRRNSSSSFSGLEDEESFSFAMESGSGNLNVWQPVSLPTLGGSLEIGSDKDSGVEGILSRLEQQRNSDFGISLGSYGNEMNATSKGERFGRHLENLIDSARIDLGENNKLPSDSQHKGLSNAINGAIRSNNAPETWRNWSYQRAGFHHGDFEAAEISYSKNGRESEKEDFYDEIVLASEEYAEAWDRPKETDHNQIQSRLQHLEAELETTLCSLRSKREEFGSEEVSGTSNDLHKLSDALEFQQNEFMSAQEKLRSIRANLAVLEGKMALSVIHAQKMVEEKQKRINGAHRALQLLRTASIVWPNSASEVLLAGSFDGWTTQRKMEKSKTGIFSLSLKLYPGRYEIKFIVDGIWKVDPLRPIVYNNGYENNLFLVT